MRICLIGKYPPIQGGVSVRTYWTVRWLAERGHDIHVVTNASEVEPEFAVRFLPGDYQWLTPRFAAGSVRIWSTEPHGPRTRHIPDHNPFVTKLASLAIEAIEQNAIDVVLTSYLEPYAVAGWMAARLTGRPLIVRHAGSDVGRLMLHPQLGPCYRRLLRDADVVCGSASTRQEFARHGVQPEHLSLDPGFVVPDVFNPASRPVNLNELLQAFASQVGSGDAAVLAPIDTSSPVVGVYGKFGPAKGTFDLIGALGHLKARGRDFRFVAIGGGAPGLVARFDRAVRDAGIRDETRLIPFVAHWRIPGVLRNLTAACFLEHRFPIARHSPGIPQEVLAAGAPLVTTLEIARKQRFAASLVHGYNAMIVRDPSDRAELASALDGLLSDPGRAAALGREGHACLPSRDGAEVAKRYEAVFAHALGHGRAPVTTGNGRTRGLGQGPFRLSRLLLGALDQIIPEPLAANDAHSRAVHMKRLLYERWSQTHVPAYAGEVLRWEMCQVPDPVRARASDELFFRAATRDIGSEIPQVAANLEICTFAYDMESLIRALDRSETPPVDWPEAQSHYVVQHAAGAPRTQVTRLGARVHDFVAQIDGRSDVSTLLARTGAFSESDEVARHAVASVEKLFEQGVLFCSSPTGRRARHASHAEDICPDRPDGRRPQEARHTRGDQERRVEASGSRSDDEEATGSRQADLSHRGQA